VISNRYRLVALSLLWALCVGRVLYPQIRGMQLPFELHSPRDHLKQLLNGQKLKAQPHFTEEVIRDRIAAWDLTAPVEVALPPMYADTEFGNAGFLTSFVDGDVIFYNGPYPHPKLEISERVAGTADPGFDLYHFENRRSNAALSTNVSGLSWPYGYTAWYDFVFDPRSLTLHTPRLIGSDGTAMDPIAVHAVSPRNHAELLGPITAVSLTHLSPIVWTFSGTGRLEKSDEHFAIESIPDGTDVSWISRRPENGYQLGMMLLAPAVDHGADARAPSWWTLDEQLRHAVLAGRPADEKRALLRQLADAYPGHPMLEHYRVVAELGGDRFDEVWLAHQARGCDIAEWYLIAWSHVPWSRAQQLDCVKKIDIPPFYEWRVEIAEWLLIAYREHQDDPLLRRLAERAVTTGFLTGTARSFNYPLNDFAWLWLRSRQ
jgi:hypothetical protein